MIDSSEKINTCFQAAIDQRSKFIIALPKEISSISGIEASLEDLDASYLYLDASALDKFSPRWEGIEIICYFRLVTKKEPRKEMFFNFSSIISNLEKSRIGGSKFRLNLPTVLKIGQRRSSLRVDLNPKHLLGYSIWSEDKFIRTASKENKKGLHKPLACVDHIRSGLIRIIDISAGGLKKRLKAQALNELGMKWKKGQSMIIWMVLLEPDNGNKEQFWLKAKIKYLYEDYVSKDMDLGIEFKSFGQITPDKKMKWHKVKDHSIDKIGNWTYQRYLEEYRQGLV
ncbi:MAG: hypothetical protein D5R98_00185 [Desulfonatronovibrio sp. MSAO_Bac4]|nr:MAG: hypothetical protein D5R98_00185 [Desulfonatronovibrio sp. MSAO_Bac4]